MNDKHYPISIECINQNGNPYYYAYMPDFGLTGCTAMGSNINETLALLEKAKNKLIRVLVETGRPIPEPHSAIRNAWDSRYKGTVEVAY